MKSLKIPQDYKSLLDIKQTEKAIKLTKDFFQSSLSSELRLRRVTAPLFVEKDTGINDDLNGTEKPVEFRIKDINNTKVEIVHSLAKWKRVALADYGINNGFGIYTDMNALRPDEILSNIHSVYVDQWDWERVILKEERNIDFLKSIVNKIYSALYNTEFVIYENYPEITPSLPEKITFIHAEDLLIKYPNMSPKERENEIAKKHKAVFIIGIGNKLSNGEPHDGRAPDYDDWSSKTKSGYYGLNGDIIVWNPVLEMAFELSSMGIRVDKSSLIKQLQISNQEDRKELSFHKKLINNELPLSIGGGIGQSRLCMFLLQKAHIGEIQTSLWSDSMRITCSKNNINLL